MERVSVFIDGANFYGGLRTINPKYTDNKFDFNKYIKKIIGKNRKLIKVYYYNASLKQHINQAIFQKQQDMFNRLKNRWGFEVILCKRQKKDNDDGTIKHVIKGDDIHLALDMLKGAYENDYDTAILFSGDGDFAKLAEYVSKKGKKVENYHFANTISFDLLKECKSNICIDKKTVNKYFYKGT
ncbi:NYN domain-containing protein [Candidatus Pacearchaeota archaeon]|nr:NYN domain-containing protein [Candidatus Pacearchaeota archaeon]